MLTQSTSNTSAVFGGVGGGRFLPRVCITGSPDKNDARIDRRSDSVDVEKETYQQTNQQIGPQRPKIFHCTSCGLSLFYQAGSSVSVFSGIENKKNE